METVSTQDFVQAMGQHVSSVCIITTTLNGERFGLTATAVNSICATPPRLLVCVNTSGSTHAKILAAGVLCVNVLAEGHDEIAKAFAGLLGKDFDKFSQGTWTELKTQSPVLNETTAVFDCHIVETIAQFTHSIFICEVVATRVTKNTAPLLYGNQKFRHLRKIEQPKSNTPEVDDTLQY